MASSSLRFFFALLVAIRSNCELLRNAVCKEMRISKQFGCSEFRIWQRLLRPSSSEDAATASKKKEGSAVGKCVLVVRTRMTLSLKDTRRDISQVA